MNSLVEIFALAVRAAARIFVGLLFIIGFAGGFLGILYYLSTHPNVFLTILLIILTVWFGWLAHAIGHDFIG